MKKPKFVASLILTTVAVIGAGLFLALPSSESQKKPSAVPATVPRTSPAPATPTPSSKKPVDLLKDEKRLVNHEVNFYNVTDFPPTPPYMSIRFGGLPNESIESVNKLRDLIDEQVKAVGGVYEVAHYERLNPIITSHVKELISSGAAMVAIEFPRKREGILLYQKK